MKELRIILVLSLIFLIVGCTSSKKEQELDEIKLMEEFTGIEVSEITTMSIRTQMADDYPREKILTDKEDIKKIIEFISNIDGTKISMDEDKKGWQFWILFEGYNISIIGNQIDLNNEIYLVDPSISDELYKIYEGIEVDEQRYP